MSDPNLLEPSGQLILDLTSTIQFRPNYTPRQMLEFGVFGGSYFEMATEKDFEGLGDIEDLARQNTDSFDVKKNYFGVKAGSDYNEWMKNGWIFEEDPIGWFHWYCRYHNGRRHIRDEWQINRFNRYMLRWGHNSYNQLKSKGKISPVVMQGLLQWGIDPLQRY